MHVSPEILVMLVILFGGVPMGKLVCVHLVPRIPIRVVSVNRPELLRHVCRAAQERFMARWSGVKLLPGLVRRMRLFLVLAPQTGLLVLGAERGERHSRVASLIVIVYV